MRIDPGPLLTFLAIHEAGGFNRASHTLHKSQPALTRTVHQLEDMIGARVFTRNANGVQITAEGEMLLEYARVVRAEIGKAELGLERIRADNRVALTIGMAPVHPLDIFAMALADLVNERPNLDVKLVVETEAELLSLLREGVLGFAITPMPSPQDIGELQVEPIFTDRAAVSICCRPSHPIARLARPTTAALADAKWIMGPPGSAFRDRLDGLLSKEGFRPARVVLEVDDERARRGFILECDMLSVFSLHNVVDLVHSGQLVEVNYPFGCDDQPLVALSSRENRPIMTAFASYLRQRYQKGLGDRADG